MQFKFTTIKYIALVVLIILIGAFYWLKTDVNSPSKPNSKSEEMSISKYFSSKLAQKIGPAYEGYEPYMIMNDFPGIISSDFHTVKAMDGTYKYSDGKLILEKIPGRPQKSDSESIADYDTLLTNISSRLNMPVKNYHDIDNIIDNVDSFDTNQ